MKTTLFLDFGVLFWVSGAPTRIQILKKGLYMIYFCEICISESTLPIVTKTSKSVSGTPSYAGRGHS